MKSCAMELIAMGVGYLVFLKASKEKGGLRQAGRIIGAVIVAVAILTGVCGMRCKMGGKCYFSAKAPMCPVSIKPSASQE